MIHMQEFLDLLKAGKFCVPVCTSCGFKAWPPSKDCPKCLSVTTLQEAGRIGSLVEFSQSYVRTREGKFGIIDMGGFLLVGGLRSERLAVGMKLKMYSCGLRDDGSPYYDFEPVQARH
jgi:uncharacterized OB-fold protein